MSKNRWAIALISLLLGGFLPRIASASRTVVSTESPYVVEVWGIEDGLPQSSVFSITQAHDGYLWLGTLNGLVRFDGVKFDRFDEANTPELNSSRIMRIFEDSRENLWVGTESAGVALVDKSGRIRNFEIGQGNRNGQLATACEDSSGTIWLLTGNGLLGWYRNGELNVAPVACKSVIAEKSGSIWLGTDKALFAIQAPPSNSPAFIVEQGIPIKTNLDFLLASQKEGYWRLADGVIEKWKGSERQRSFGKYPWTVGTPVLAACEDREGNLIVGTYGDGIYWFDAEGKYIRLSGELSHNSILSLTVDREGNLWVGTNGGGLNRVKRKIFGVLPGSEGLVVQSVCDDGAGGLWIGYNGNRIDHWKDGTLHQFNPIRNFEAAQNSYAKSVFLDRQQRVWAGIWSPLRSNLFQFVDGSFVPARHAEIIDQDVSVLYQDHSNHLWVGTQNGLARWDGDGWSWFSGSEGSPGNEVRAMGEDAGGNLWIGSGGGLARWRAGEFAALHKKDGLPSDDVSCLYVDMDDVLWVGTRGSGLARFQNGKWTHYTTGEGLIGNSIGYLIEDGQTNLWLGSNAGLMRVPKKSLNDFAAGRAENVSGRAYVEADGLPTRECTQGSQPAACRDARGVLWLPTTKGLVSVDPAVLRPNPYQPPVIVESVLIEGQQTTNNLHAEPKLRAEPLPAIVVPAGPTRLEIHYTSLNLGSAERSRFRFRLQGHETAWNDVGNTRVARYSKLPPGDYTFQVVAANEDGIWNPTPTSLGIQVLPPFWRTGWFISLATAMLLGLIVAIVYYFSTQKLQRQLAVLRQQEELEKERARIARDLHDQLGANLTQVALLGELAETDKDLPDEVESHARQIHQTARETTKALDEIVWAINPSNDTLEGLINYICKYAQEYFEIAGLRYRLDVPPDLPPALLPPEVRHNVFLAAKEAINNIVKHAQATEAWFRLKLESNRVLLEIEDNGRGLAGMNEKSGRNGLRNMRKRLEDVGGNFSISPAPKQGAIVRLIVPIRKS
jgi:signal transduction histidine kinase/ligand-binding sensor domain-containing protein